MALTTTAEPVQGTLFAQESGENAAAGPSAHELGDAALSERTRLIAGIIELNPTAAPAWLERFKDAALRNYLRHLDAAAKPRGRGAVWVREGETPALLAMESAA